MGLSQKIYWKSPYFVKVGLTWLHMQQVNRQRYGKEYSRIAEEVYSRNDWNSGQWEKYQLERIKQLINHAYLNVPYYRKLLQERNIDPDQIQTLEDIRLIPVLEKQNIRKYLKDFVDERLNQKQLIQAHTSGTTGSPLVIYRRTEEASTATAYFDVRCHGVAGLSRIKNRSVSIGGHLVTSPGRTKPPFWLYNPTWNQLYMSSYHLSTENMRSYVDKLRNFNPEYIEGYPSSLYALAKFIVNSQLDPVPVKACFTTAEMLHDYHRQAIESAFCCKTYNQYGCAELAVFASECDHGSMHISPDYCMAEVIDENGSPVPDGKEGYLVCTSLVNWTQPFIRYRMGDVGSICSESCSCGSQMPLLKSLEGRSGDTLITRDGRKISRVSAIFKGIDSIRTSQVIQNDYDSFVIRIAPEENFCKEDENKIINEFTNRVGKVDVKVELTDKIERTSRGKHREVINNIGSQ